MPPEYEIVCIRKGGFLTHFLKESRIEFIGYKSSAGVLIISIQQAINLIETNTCNFYVENNTNRIPVRIVEIQIGRLFPQTIKYLRTIANGVDTDNLENLPYCH